MIISGVRSCSPSDMYLSRCLVALAVYNRPVLRTTGYSSPDSAARI